jgi:hypothetical protein
MVLTPLSTIFHLYRGGPMLLIPEYMHNGWKLIQQVLDICLFRNKMTLPWILILSASLLGKDDIVRCFCCDLGLAEWDPSDDPWREHARHSHNAGFGIRWKEKSLLMKYKQIRKGWDNTK